MPPAPSLLARAASACALVLLGACTALPTIAPDTAEAAGTDTVRIAGAHGPLSPDAQKRVLDRLKAAGQEREGGGHCRCRRSCRESRLAQGGLATRVPDSSGASLQ